MASDLGVEKARSVAEKAEVGETQMDPITAAILAQIGVHVAGRVVDYFAPESQAEQLTAQQAGIGTTLIPQLQAQAAGGPTPATAAAEQRLSSEVRRAQQAAATTATRRGIGGTELAAAGQVRLEQAKVRGMADIYGQSALAGTAALTGLYGGGIQALRQQELQKRQARTAFAGDVGFIINAYQQMQQQGEMDESYMEMMQGFLRIIGGALPGVLPGDGAGATAAGPPAAWTPPPAFYGPPIT